MKGGTKKYTKAKEGVGSKVYNLDEAVNLLKTAIFG